jgi:peptide/nickel transport system permease protein
MATTATPVNQLNLQAPTTTQERTMRGMIWNQFRRHRLAVAGLVVLAVLSLGAIFVPYISPYPPELSTFQERRAAMANKDMAPSLAHPMGTDPLGRDIMTRLLYGGRISLTIGLLATAVGIVIGTVVGAVAGFYGGWVDNALMRLTDMFIALPRIFMLIIMSLLMRDLEVPILRAYGGAGGIILILGILSWTNVARVVRGQFLSLKEKEFVEAARTLGIKNMRIVFRHVLPNTATPVIVAATLLVGATIISESGLSFLGFGVQPPTPTWGNMLNSAQSEMLNGHWWMAVFPGLMIFFTVISINYIGEGLRDALDPRKLN